jgi:hypothetical protein
MSYHDLYILIIIGGSFLVLGIIGILWGKKEEGSWYGSIPDHVDVREFVDHLPLRPEPNALKIGGRICIILAIVILLVSGSFYLWGMTPTP